MRSRGSRQIGAAAGGLSGALQVPILGAGDPFTVTLGTTPAGASAGGPDVDVSAAVVDGSGASVPDGTVVSFATDLGVLSTASAATKGGKAAARLSPGTVAGPAHVTARAGLVQGAATIIVAPGPIATVSVGAQPKELVAEYGQLATISATGKDQYGNMAADGLVIHFNTTLGELIASTAPTQNGRGQVQLFGGLVAGVAQVTATAPGGAHGSTTVTVKPGAAAQLTFAAQPLDLTAGGGAGRLRATVKDAHDNLVASGIPVTFTTDLGQLQPAGGGTGAGSRLVVLTNGGVAEADLAPGPTAGVAHVTASDIAPVAEVGATNRPAGRRGPGCAQRTACPRPARGQGGHCRAYQRPVRQPGR